MFYDEIQAQHRRTSQTMAGNPFRDSPDGGPGVPPQTQAAMAATTPSFTTPYTGSGGVPGNGGVAAGAFGGHTPSPQTSMPPPSQGGPPAASPASPQGPPSHPYGSAGSLIAGAYNQYLGRTPSAQEIGSHLGYGKAMSSQNVMHALASIRESEEAKARAAAPPAAPAAPTAPAPGVQNRAYLGGGFSDTKLNDPSHQTAKYIVGRTLSGFDPSQGLTPEVLAALNALGLAEFYGSGDKGGYRNVTEAGRAAGIKDSGYAGDWIKNFSGEGPKTWRYAAPGQAERDAGGAGGAQGGAMGAQGAGLFQMLSNMTGQGGQTPASYTDAILAQLAHQLALRRFGR